MKRSIATLLFLPLVCAAWGEESGEPVRVSGEAKIELSAKWDKGNDEMGLTYRTDDPRLGTNSGNRYESVVSDKSRGMEAVYGVDLDLDIREKHVLTLSFEGKHDLERAFGTREEALFSAAGTPLSRLKGAYDHSNELAHELEAAIGYTYRLRRPGSTIHFGYGYQWENELGGLEQEIEEAKGWDRYKSNMLEQKITKHHHHAQFDYVCPVAKGHLLDFGTAYDRRDLSVRTEQKWDEQLRLDTDYRHTMQYGSLYGRYRLKMGPVEAMARLEYRATKMQNRWLHDVLPTATIRYHLDDVHSLSAFYTIVLIRPEAQHLDTTHIVDAFTEKYGNDDLVGIHLHNVALTYQLQMQQVRASFEARYLTTNDGFNAIWMERGNQRIYTWRNEGVRHAVGLTPTVDAALSPTTNLHATATVMWDKRVAEAIKLYNPNWGIRSQVTLQQQLYASEPATVSLHLHGAYSYHNTLDVYSYEGHGGRVGLEGLVAVREKLHLALGYACAFTPDVHIVQGAYVGVLNYCPGASHAIELKAKYTF